MTALAVGLGAAPGAGGAPSRDRGSASASQRGGGGEGKNARGPSSAKAGKGNSPGKGNNSPGNGNSPGKGTGKGGGGQVSAPVARPARAAPQPSEVVIAAPSTSGAAEEAAPTASSRRTVRRTGVAAGSRGGGERTSQPGSAAVRRATAARLGSLESAPPFLSISALARDLPGAANGEPTGTGEPMADGDSFSQAVREIVEIVPPELTLALAALGAVSLLGLAGWLIAGLRSRRLSHRQAVLEDEVGALQSALLPVVPPTLNGLRASVAYRPATGPGAGGDFYDVFAVSADKVGVILGDASGHGREALPQTVFIRHTLRAYLEAGLEPRLALALAGSVMDEQLDGSFATVLVAVHDSARGELAIASAGHPAPIVTGVPAGAKAGPFVPVTAASSPPVGFGYATGRRQTTISLPEGALACFYTDGLTEARTADGFFGRERLERLCEQLGPQADASTLLEQVAAESEDLADDLAACTIGPTGRGDPAWLHVEELEVDGEDLPARAAAFLAGCGVDAAAARQSLREASRLVDSSGAAVLRVEMDEGRPRPAVVPHHVSPLADQHSHSAV
ncbi:MAG: PP2C family protein-serine/threonine phosphatase [Thermoleophilaceae bacterium]